MDYSSEVTNGRVEKVWRVFYDDLTGKFEVGDNFIGEAKIMSTPMGEIVKSLMDEGATLGVSSRGMGSLDQRGGVNYVKNDFKLATKLSFVNSVRLEPDFALIEI